jgi:hypothetical protein
MLLEVHRNGNIGCFVNAFGDGSAINNTGNNVIALGTISGSSSPLSNVFIVSNIELPTYLDFITASGALGGGASGNTAFISRPKQLIQSVQ